MIVAIVLADNDEIGHPSYFETANDETVIERVTATILRGPFGGTLVAAHPSNQEAIREALSGFAVQHIDISSNTTGTQSILAAGLKAADAFRTRWEKAMAAATGRFDKSGEKDLRDSAAKLNDSAEWSKLKKNPDVKIRGLARSFDRDGILVAPADSLEIKKEHLAQMVEVFAREGQQPHPKSFAQGISGGVRGWPVMMTLDGAREIAALPSGTVLTDWLLKNVERVCDVTLSL